MGTMKAIREGRTKVDLRAHDGSTAVWLTAGQRKKLEATLKMLERAGAGALLYQERS